MNNKTVCPSCGAAELVHDTRDVTYTYKGQTTVIPGVEGEFCPACAEIIMDQKNGDRYMELIGQFQRQVDDISTQKLARQTAIVLTSWLPK